jgi:C4-dicarboxylate transporter DctQ subunit
MGAVHGSPKPLRAAAAAANRILSAAEVIFVGAALAFASALLFANVVLRYVFLAPISWAEELSLYLIVWMVFVAGSVAVRTRGHIAIDLLPLVLSGIARQRLALTNSLLMMIFFAAFFYYSALHTIRVRSVGQVTPVMIAPMWLTYLAMPVGSALMFLRTGQLAWRLFSDRASNQSFAMNLQD